MQNEVAEGIADAILSASIHGVADRIALKGRAINTADDPERDLGGLNRNALVVVILAHMRKAALSSSHQEES